MNGPWFVEELSRTNQVLARHRHEQLPIRIGRAYDNDVILNDPHIAPHHALIEARPESEGMPQSGVQVRDLGSKNGIVHQNQPCQQLTLHGDHIFRLGHTRACAMPVTR
jgi:pSer/pThr/pTyr-binding forkhead associated (FHA) protein